MTTLVAFSSLFTPGVSPIINFCPADNPSASNISLIAAMTNGPPPHHFVFPRRRFVNLIFSATSLSVLGLVRSPASKAARPEGVNRPELLPSQFTTVIDLEKFLTTGQIRRLRDKIDDLENRTGFKIRLLTQRYPQTPGLAVRDYWEVNDNTVVIVADYFGGSGQLLKFNVGQNVDRLLPPRFWSILSANYGNKFYVSKHSEALSIINAIESVRTCLLSGGCATPPRDLESVIF